jgi:hypothetical protein
MLRAIGRHDMPATLTFYPRRALLEATGAGLTVQVPIHQDPTRVRAWDHVFEVRPGRHTLWDYAFEVPASGAASNGVAIYLAASGAGTLEIHDYPGMYAHKFAGEADVKPHTHPGPVVYIGTRSSGIYLHGRPACNRSGCIVVLEQWDRIRLAVAAEKSLSFAVFL